MALESNFCQTMRLNAQLDELENINTRLKSDGTTEEQLYFEF